MCRRWVVCCGCGGIPFSDENSEQQQYLIFSGHTRGDEPLWKRLALERRNFSGTSQGRDRNRFRSLCWDPREQNGKIGCLFPNRTDRELDFDVVQEREREWSGFCRDRKRHTLGWLRMACSSPGPHGQPDGTRSLNFDVVQGRERENGDGAAWVVDLKGVRSAG